MSLNNSRGRLMALSREFLQTWQSTQDTWQDQKAREFDVSYMQPLFDSVDNAVAAIEDLDKVLHQLRKDCEIE